MHSLINLVCFLKVKINFYGYEQIFATMKNYVLLWKVVRDQGLTVLALWSINSIWCLKTNYLNGKGGNNNK